MAEIPADFILPGILNYRIIIQKSNNSFSTFPGNYKGDPYAWDNVNQTTWQTFVAPQKGALEIYNPNVDRDNMMIYNSDSKNNSFQFIASEKPYQLAVKITVNDTTPNQLMGWQIFFGDKLKGRQSEFASFNYLVVRARANESSQLQLRVGLITTDALCFATKVSVDDQWKNIRIPLSDLQIDSCLLLPRPYPGFLSLWFKANASKNFQLLDAEKLEISFETKEKANKPLSLEIETVWLEK